MFAAIRVGAALAVVAGVLSLHAAPGDAAEATVEVLASAPWTPTDLTVAAGDTVTITAEGTMHLGPVEALDQVAPDGVACGELCVEIESLSTNWTAPGLAHWSLIARVGEGDAIAVGSESSFVAEFDGLLSLGVNDNNFDDNAGSWTAGVVVEPASAAAAPVPVPGESSGGGFNVLPVLLVLVVLAGLGVLLVIGLRRRREVGQGADDASGAAPVTPLLPTATPTADQETYVPAEDDAIDVNIFEVTIADDATLRVGYNFFPEGTSVRWRLAQNGTARSEGEFVTLGGGVTYHFVVQAIEPHLPPGGGSVDVNFDWTIGGVPFGYSVRRVSNT